MAGGIDNLTPFTKHDDRASKAGSKSSNKGFKHINTWVQELMHDEDFEGQIQNGYQVDTYKGAPIKAIVQAQIRKAINGDTKAYDSLVKSGWVQKVETDITSGGEKLEVGLSDERLEQIIKARAGRTDI